jgi:hypothetical protein
LRSGRIRIHTGSKIFRSGQIRIQPDLDPTQTYEQSHNSQINQFSTVSQIRVKLARKYLATPASSVYSERLFSEYGNIFEEKRARLLPKNGEKLLFLHHNMKRLA